MTKKAKGYVIMLQTIDAAVAFAIMLALASVFTAYVKNNKAQTVKVECYNANVSAIEEIKKLFYETGNKSIIEGYNSASGKLTTTVTECIEIKPGSGTPVTNSKGVQIYDGNLLPYNRGLKSDANIIYFVTVETTHENKEVKNTALSVFLTARN